MASIHDIIFCLTSTNADGQGVNAHTILSVINPEYVPGLFSFATIITILGLDQEKDHALKVTITKEKEDMPITSLEGPIPKIETAGNLPIEYQGINLSINWNNINFKESGIYELSVFLDNEKLGNKCIFVKGKNQNE